MSDDKDETKTGITATQLQHNKSANHKTRTSCLYLSEERRKDKRDGKERKRRGRVGTGRD
jgi:hypothetical protein